MTHPKSSDENQNLLCEAVCWVWMDSVCGPQVETRTLLEAPNHHLHYSSQHQSQLAVLRRPAGATEDQVQNFEL